VIAIRDRRTCSTQLTPSRSSELFELLLAGDNHWDLTVSNVFFEARRLASLAVSENSDANLIVAALLVRPCQMLACGSLQAGDWTSNSLLETGTYDWLVKNFGDEVSELIRMQPAAKRFLATVIPDYFRSLKLDEQKNFFHEGGYMTSAEKTHFSNLRRHNRVMRIANWIDQGVSRYIEVPQMEFFLPFVESALLG
jgi:predicted HD phosphohydrolase